MWYRSQFWTDFHEIHMVGASPHMCKPLLFFLETICQIEALIWGKICPQNWLLAFIQSVCCVLWKKFQTRIRCPISHRKGFIHFCRPDTPFPKKWSSPPKIIFRSYFGKYCCFFFEKILIWKILKISFLIKKFILSFVAGHPFPLKMVMSSNKWFFAIFPT